jgi:hypothetical protein
MRSTIKLLLADSHLTRRLFAGRWVRSQRCRRLQDSVYLERALKDHGKPSMKSLAARIARGWERITSTGMASGDRTARLRRVTSGCCDRSAKFNVLYIFVRRRAPNCPKPGFKTKLPADTLRQGSCRRADLVEFHNRSASNRE